MIRPKIRVLVIYKSEKSKNWRGFCSPYDVSCEAKTLEEAKSKLAGLVNLYEEGLKKYGYPEHLSILPLSEKQDIKVFKMVINQMANQLTGDYLKFQSEADTRIKTRDFSAYANVMQPCPA